MFKWFGAIRREAGYAHVSLDETDHVLSWNEGAQQLFGWSAEEVLGTLLSDFLVPPAYREAHRRGLERLHQGLPDGRLLGKELHTTALHKDGHLITIRMLVTRLFPHQGRPYYVASLSLVATEFVVLGPEGPIASPVASEREAMRRRNEALMELLADATSDLLVRRPPSGD